MSHDIAVKNNVVNSLPTAGQSLDGAACHRAVTNKPNTNPKTNPNPKIIKLLSKCVFRHPHICRQMQIASLPTGQHDIIFDRLT